jgi:Bacterial pullanase-associated domain
LLEPQENQAYRELIWLDKYLTERCYPRHASLLKRPTAHVRIRYFRPDGNYLGWTAYAFGDTTEDTSNFNGGPVKVTGQDSFGAYLDVGITSGVHNVGIIIHKGNSKTLGLTNFSIRRRKASSTGSFRAATYCTPLRRPRSRKPIHRFPRRAFTIITQIMTTRSGTASHFLLPPIRT